MGVRRLSLREGHRLDGLPVLVAYSRKDASGGDEGDRQDDRDGLEDGWGLSEGGRPGARQGYRRHGCEGCTFAGRLRGHQHGSREGYRVRADQYGDGRLQRDGKARGELSSSEFLVLEGEPSGRGGGVQRLAGVQGCGEGGAEVSVVALPASMQQHLVCTSSFVQVVFCMFLFLTGYNGKGSAV